MAASTLRSGCALSVLCGVLKRNDIGYEMINKDRLCCFFNVGEREEKMIFTVDSVRMLVTLYAPICRDLSSAYCTEASTALCMLNHKIRDGAFCYDPENGLLYFRLTASFYNSSPDEFMFEYMLSAAAETVDRVFSLV